MVALDGTYQYQNQTCIRGGLQRLQSASVNGNEIIQHIHCDPYLLKRFEAGGLIFPWRSLLICALFVVIIFHAAKFYEKHRLFQRHQNSYRKF